MLKERVLSMSADIIFKLQEVGVDTDAALRRFSNNDMLYKRFLLRFPEDQNFVKIEEAMKSCNWSDMLTAAHTLKGLSGNLGMNRLLEICSSMTTYLREGRSEDAVNLYPELEEAYREIYLILETSEEEN